MNPTNSTGSAKQPFQRAVKNNTRNRHGNTPQAFTAPGTDRLAHDTSLIKIGARMKNSKLDIALDNLINNCETGKPLSAKQIASACNCTANYIRKIENNAIKKLQQIASTHPINDFTNSDLNDYSSHQEQQLFNPMRLHY